MKDVNINQIYATDKEVYDLIMASPKRMTDSTIGELIASRRIFCSHQCTRQDLADYYSGMQHDYHSIADLVQRGEHVRRIERTTSVEFETELTPEEIKEAAIEYRNMTNRTEVVNIPFNTLDKTRINIEYDEIDYSRTRLIQRQRKHAEIDFTIRGGKTRIRMPANEKSRNIVRQIKEIISSKRQNAIASDEINVSDLTSTRDRNAFFMQLIAQMPGFRLEMVTDTKVTRRTKDDDDDEPGDKNEAANEAQREIISVVNSVSMKGVNVIMTPEYQKFLEQDFFLTAITWRSIQTDAPNDLVQFEVAFEDARGGTNFRYAVRYAPMLDRQRHARTLQPVSEPKRSILFNLVEDTARNVLRQLRA